MLTLILWAMALIERSPDGGIPYRISRPATRASGPPCGLVVWLHPAGRAFDEAAESLAPVFHARGLALMLPDHKDRKGWSGEDGMKLLGSSLPDAGRQPGVDASRPILFGFSGGGQLAMTLWHAKPGAWGGVIVDAAYPLDEVNGKQMAMDPPSDPRARFTPLFVLVGDKDPVSKSWSDVESAWRAAGIPLTIRRVPDKGHEWLFGEAEIAALADWMKGLTSASCQAVAPPQEEPAPAVHP